jgi:hypothetical protein
VRLTLGELKPFVTDYIGANNNVNDRIGLACFRLLQRNDESADEPVEFQVAADENGEGFITLPRKYDAIRATVIGSKRSGWALPMRNFWYQSIPGGTGIQRGSDSMRGVIPLAGRYTTIFDWNVPLQLRFKFEQSETAGKIIVRGTLIGSKIYSLDSSTWIEGVAVPYSGTSDVTTTQLFDAPPYSILKPVTKGRVSMYTVDGDGIELFVGSYDPTETNPAWRRYKVPVCPTDIPTVTPVPLTAFYTASQIDAMFGEFSSISVSANGTTDLNPATKFAQWFIRITAQAGAGSYTYNFALKHDNPKIGAMFWIAINLSQSSNPTINIYDNSTSGTLLQTVSGDSSNATFYLLQCEYTGTAWQKVSGVYLT